MTICGAVLLHIDLLFLPSIKNHLPPSRPATDCDGIIVSLLWVIGQRFLPNDYQQTITSILAALISWIIPPTGGRHQTLHTLELLGM